MFLNYSVSVTVFIMDTLWVTYAVCWCKSNDKWRAHIMFKNLNYMVHILNRAIHIFYTLPARMQRP